MPKRKRPAEPPTHVSHKAKSSKRRKRETKRNTRETLQMLQPQQTQPTQTTAQNHAEQLGLENASNPELPSVGHNVDDRPTCSHVETSPERTNLHHESQNAPIASCSSTPDTHRNIPQISSDEITKFWQKNFRIHTQYSTNVTNEETVLQMFLDQHPRFQNSDAQYFKRNFQQMTHSELPQIRRFKIAKLKTHSYNVERTKDIITAQTQVKFSLLNTQGLITTRGRNKSKTISDLILDPTSQHIIALTETFLTKDVEDAEVLNYFPSYTLNRGDRDTEAGRKHKQGGCLLLTSPEIPSIKTENFSNGVCEALTTTHPTLDLTIITAYRPPDTTKPEFDDLLTFIESNLSKTHSTHTIITGDFNFPKEIVTWLDSQDGLIPVPTRYISDDRKLQLLNLLELVDRHFLHQIVSLPTRSKTTTNILDLIFTNSPELFHSPQTTDMSGTSDHDLISFNTDFVVDVPQDHTVNHSRTGLAAYNFRRANSEELTRALTEKNLTNIVSQAKDPISGKAALIQAIIEVAEDTNVPKHHSSPNLDQTPTIRKLYKTRVALLQKTRKKGASKDDLTQLNIKLQEIQQQISDAIQTESLQKERNIAEQIKTNPKAFYKYANSLRKTKTKIGPLRTSTTTNTSFTSGPQKMAEILSAQYKSVFTTPKNSPPTLPPRDITSILNNIEIYDNDMSRSLKSISDGSTPGPDGISAFFLKTYADVISPALCLLWRMSLDSGIMPDDINLAYITPIFKGGDKSIPANYRPVALTNHTTKAFEKIIRQEIIHHLATQQLLNPTQHGFTSGKSTLTNLVEYYESILLLLEHHQQVDAIYLDYSKAFDKCDHDIILAKLENLGIRGKLNKWISAFLKRRQQSVSIQGHKSIPVWCHSGVPQGSVLGPLLFLILMIDIDKSLKHSILSSFADDTKVWKAILNKNTEALLQEDLDRIYVWADINNMTFNSDKFQAIRFAELTNPPHYTTDEHNPMDTTELVKDLGIHMSSDMHFDQHIRILYNKGKRTAGWITRVFASRDPQIMLTLLKQLIYPTVEYNCVLWNPADQALIDLLENVQRNFTRKIETTNLPSNDDYWDRLKHFKLYSMQRRRERYSIFYVWKVLHKLYPNPGLHLNTSTQDHTAHPNKGIQTNVHDRLGITTHHPSNPPKWLRRCSPLESCCNLYNCIPPNLRQPVPENQEPCFAEFKKNVDDWLSKIPDRPACTTRPKFAQSNSILHQVKYISR